MKKIILSIAAVFAFALTSDAQTRKGTVLLGAGSQLTETAWTDLQITPKVGYFVQDGIAIGAMVNFGSQTNSFTLNQGSPNPQDVEITDTHMEVGVFGRYYVSNNLFAQLELSNASSTNEEWGTITQVTQALDQFGNPVFQDDDGDGIFEPVFEERDVDQVVESSRNTTNFGLGLGYTIVWREHFAVEPYVNLLFTTGEEKNYDATNFVVRSEDVKATDFQLGVNFSLFF